MDEPDVGDGEREIDAGVMEVEFHGDVGAGGVRPWRSGVSHGLLGLVRRLLADEVDGIEVSGVTVQSDETVRRDFEGSWFYALR